MAESAGAQAEIIEAARKEFVARGYEGARLQNIADNTGATKAMIHYYFNTKRELFEQVFHRSSKEVFGGLGKVLSQKIPLFKKIEELIELCLKTAENNPEVLAFVITESMRKPEWLQAILKEQLSLPLKAFNSELKEAASTYRIASVTAGDLLLNVFSLCYYPVVSETVNHALLGSAPSSKIAERKGIILDTVLNWLTA